MKGSVNAASYNSRSHSFLIARIAIAVALVACTTMISIPLPAGGGYIHAGDAAIFVSCYLLGWWAVPAAAIGSALADLLLGYQIFVPATFVIKGVMAAITVLIAKKSVNPVRLLVAYLLASVFMQLAYTLYQYVLAFGGYDFVDILTETPAVMVVSFFLGCLQSVFAVPVALFVTSRLSVGARSFGG